MNKAFLLFEIKTYILTAIAIISFSQFVGQLFGVTIPNFIWTFFKSFGEVVILAAVFAFAFAWLLKARPHNKPKSYTVVIFDVYGKETQIDGIRKDFKTHDVAWSFMKDYKKSYPLHNFALVSDVKKSEKKTIFRYI
ncbi:hypothetical protein C6988_00090 [Nitrosopumilus sp. b1]|uniref:hypothetical protein n=1 Tax=Nitrosopumilus sp. b1 TaxID=2109907 RepID=UPI0015F70C10|nr:hypothetical protein [Nitrosopumilus sp. b1]KAF6244029.1 hypothetical protein C6988_00090 [Nitrosopumilus sp. b1]